MPRWPLKPPMPTEPMVECGIGAFWPGTRRWDIEVPGETRRRCGYWDAPTTRFMYKGDGVWLDGTLYAVLDSGEDKDIPWVDLAEVLLPEEDLAGLVEKYEAGELGVTKPRTAWERLVGVEDKP